MNTRKPIAPGMVLNSSSIPDTIEVHDYGQFPVTLTHTQAGDGLVKFIAPNGRIYSARLEGNRLRVSAQEGGIYVRPKGDNVVEVVNLTPFERDTEEGMQ